MPQVTQHPAGSPCWFELGTTDQSGAKAFYSEMFGWSALDFPMGPGGSYTLFQLGGKDVAGGYKLMPEQQQQQNIPPNWLVYFNTPDCDATAAKAVELGGAIVKPPMDVMALGRMAVLQDREKAVFALWEARMHIGAGVVQGINTVGWSELATRDSAAAVAFYSALFGWKTAPSQTAPTQYTEFAVNGEQMGGILQMNEQWEGMPSAWGIYIMVEDCKASAAKAKELGAKICHGPFEAPNVGWITILSDPQGAMLSIIQLKQRPA